MRIEEVVHQVAIATLMGADGTYLYTSSKNNDNNNIEENVLQLNIN